jgi:pimeloyl-ACP methyl ester carboxylesterase
MRSTPFSPLNQTLKLFSRSGPELTERTKMLLRRYDLLAVYEKDPEGCLAELQVLAETENASETTYAISELAFTLGQRAQQAEDTDGALDMFSLGVANAYLYLFSPRMDSLRNPYDPQFRGACDLYNASLESVLRIINDRGMLRPGGTYVLNDDTQEHTVSVRTVGGWHDDDFDRIEFCNDYDVDGLHTTNVTYGIGVPLIAVRKSHATAETAERYYPEGLSFPVTALLRVTTPLKSRPGRASRHHCVLELIDPLESNEIQMAGRVVPLQTDLSTPLAYFLDNPLFREKTDSTLGLLDPNKSQHLRGVYMLEPYDPNRIPVLMVHGLWSSPLTWMPMFNDLRSFSELRRNYQFWFYQYPTGQPFWVSATEMRGDLAELRNTVDPQHTNETLDRMVVVGHSMGGLVSRMQTVESGNDFWRILSDYPFEDVEGSPENVERLRRALFFKPNQSIRRVVTIGTPHRGSDFANDYTRWIGRKIIKLPTTLTDTGYSLARANPKLFRDSELLTTNTSIDSLSPDSPIFPVLLRAPRAPWVTYHNIIGVVPDSGFLNSFSQGGDGVVEFASAQVDGVASEIMVESRHQDIHRTARAILEVRRILDEHLKEMRQELRWAERNTHPLVTVDEARAKDSLMVQVASDVRPASFTPPTPPSKANPLEILPQSAGTATDNAFLTKRGLPEIVPAAEARSLISLPPARSPESSTRPPLAVGDFPTPPLLR